MNKVHWKLYLRTDIEAKDGKKYIYFYANVNGRPKPYAVGFSVKEKFWNPKTRRVVAGCPDFNTINSKLQAVEAWINELIIKAELTGRKLSQGDIADYFAVKANSTDLIEWMQLDLKNFAAKYSKETLHTYNTQLTKLKDYCSAIAFEDISPAWWERYERFMIERGNCENTRHKTFTHLKVFINRAVDAGIIAVNPLRRVKVKKIAGTRKFLTQDEVKLLEKFYSETTSKKYKNVLRCFLFSCFTGLRYTDIKLLTWRNIDKREITLQMHKTRKVETFPLSLKAENMLPVRRGPSERVFTCYSNQKINDYLEEIIKAARITKKITFHCARHTFATVYLELSGDIATVSKLLGHSNISTTAIYAKVLDESKKKVVSLWK